MFGLLLVLLAILLAIISIFVPSRNSILLAVAVALGFVGVLVGVDTALA